MISPDIGAQPNAAHEYSHPFVYSLLYLPFGAVFGYVSVALTYSLTHAGMTIARAGGLVAIFFLPQGLKFLWAPIVDTTLNQKAWYVIGAAMTAMSIVALSALPPAITPFGVLVTFALIMSFASSFVGMSVEALVAFSIAPEQKGRAGGWLQAGSFAGNGLGGGAALWLIQHVSMPWITGGALGTCMLLCCLPLCLVHEHPRSHERAQSIGSRVWQVLLDIWHVVRARSGYLALLLVFLPIGTGAASAYWSPVADEWHTSANVVALVNGTLGGIASGLGCLVGGYLSDRFDRKLAYVSFGLALAACAVAMALCPRTESAYVSFVLLYAFGSGVCFAGFSAVTFEAIGHGAAAFKYNVFAGFSNISIGYLTGSEGLAYSRWGSHGMLYTDAAVAVTSAAIFTSAWLLSARFANRLPEPV